MNAVKKERISVWVVWGGLAFAVVAATLSGVMLYRGNTRAPEVSRVHQGVAASDALFGEYVSFKARELCFTYCGIAGKGTNGLWGAGTAASKELPRWLPAYWVSERAVFVEIKDFQALLERLEESFRRGDEKMFHEYADRIRDTLRGQKEKCLSPTLRYRISVYFRNIEKTEYSLARMIEAPAGGIRLTVGDVKNMLGDYLFTNDFKACTWMVVGDETGLRYRRFRDMLATGLLIRRWQAEKGSLPASLRDIAASPGAENIDLSQFVYSREGDVWQLFSCFVRNGRNLAPFNAYIPVISRGRPTDWPNPDGLWLSSDFSDKRRRLYETGSLNDGDPKWHYRLENGLIVKGEVR